MSIFVCCEREDETKYFHTCDCPILTPVNRTRNRTATMCGLLDPDADDGIYYKIRKNTGELDRYLDGPLVDLSEYSRDDDGICQVESSSTGSQNCQGFGTDNVGPYYKEIIYEYQADQSSLQGTCGGTATVANYDKTLTKSWDGSNCTITESDDAQDAQITIGTSCNQPCVPDEEEGFDQIGQTYSGGGSIPNSDGFWDGTINGTVVEDSSCLEGGSSVTYPVTFDIYLDATLVNTTLNEELDQSDGGTIEQGFSYESPDSDEAAEEAAEWSEWSGVSEGRAISYDQDRNKTGSFGQQEAEYAFIAKSLVIGKSYSASVGTEDCDYIVNEPENCVEGTPISVAFLANDIFKIIGGTLNSSVSRDDFVDNDYSVDPTDYNLPDGEDVIESLTPFLVSSGEKRQMVTSPILDMD